MMRVGMLWLDDSKTRNLAEKVQRAAAYYEEKYGRLPELCFVNNGVLEGDEQQVGQIWVRPLPTILQHYFWLGLNEPGSDKAQ